VVAAADGLAEALALEAQPAAVAGRGELVRVDQHRPGNGSPGEDDQKGDPHVLAHMSSIGAGRPGIEPSNASVAFWPLSVQIGTIRRERLRYDGHMGLFAAALLAVTTLLVLAAEWPRLSARFGADARNARARRRRKSELILIENPDAIDEDDFAASVQRDLESLPVIEERDDRTRR